MLNVKNLRRLADFLVNFALGYLAPFKGKGDVFIYTFVRVQGIGLKDHSYVTVFRLDVVDDSVAYINIPY